MRKNNSSKVRNNKDKKGKYSNYNGKKFDKKYEAAESDAEVDRRTPTAFKTSRNPGNDPEYYISKNKNLLEGAFSINFSYPAGVVNDLGTGGLFKYTDATGRAGTETIPSVVTASVIPTFGRNVKKGDALNVVDQQLYTIVRRANSGARNYDPNDLGLFVLGFADVYSYINYLIRLYAIVSHTWEPMNRAIPRILCKANYASFKSLDGDLAQFRYDINALIRKVRSFIVPSVFKLFLRRASIYSKAFIESPSVRDQIYMYVPEGFYRFQLDTDKAGMLNFVPFGQAENTVHPEYTREQLIQYGDDLISNYFTFQDSGIISGDLEKAFGTTSIYTVDEIPEKVDLDITTDINVLNQFKNATLLGAMDLQNVNPFTVVQSADKSILISNPLITVNEMLGNFVQGSLTADQMNTVKAVLLDLEAGNQLFSFESPIPTMEDVIEATRLHYGYTIAQTGSTYSVSLYPGSEIANRITIWTPSTTSPGEFNATDLGQLYPLYLGNAETLNQQTDSLLAILFDRRAMKWLPAIKAHRFQFAGSGQIALTDLTEYSSMQISNYTFVDQKVLARMHEAVLISQLYVDPLD